MYRAGGATLDVAIRAKDHLSASGVPTRVLENLRLALPAGQTGAVVGPSGCGKTTLLRLIAGLDTAFDGRIELPTHRRLAMAFQEPRLLPWRNVGDNVRVAAPQASKSEIAALLREVGLAAHATHYPGELSLGLARRVSLVRALAVKPDILLLDEPLVSLDATLAQELREMLARLIERECVTTLIVTHDLREAIQLADKIFLLSPRPTLVVETLEVTTPRHRLTSAVIDALEAQARRALARTPDLSDRP